MKKNFGKDFNYSPKVILFYGFIVLRLNGFGTVASIPLKTGSTMKMPNFITKCGNFNILID
jgi:hypothetical protein